MRQYGHKPVHSIRIGAYHGAKRWHDAVPGLEQGILESRHLIASGYRRSGLLRYRPRNTTAVLDYPGNDK